MTDALSPVQKLETVVHTVMKSNNLTIMAFEIQ